MLAGNKYYSISKSLWQVLFLGLPTILLSAYIFRTVNAFFAIVHNDWAWQTVAFAVGIVFSILLFGSRAFRFFSLFIIVWLAIVLVKRIFGLVQIGNADMFLWTVRLSVYSTLFILGWLVGYSFCRWPLFSLVWSVTVISIGVYIFGFGKGIAVRQMVMGFFVLIGYSVYIIFAAQYLRRLTIDNISGTGYFVVRIFSVSIGIILVLFLLSKVFRSDFQHLEKLLEKGTFRQKSNSNSMNRQNSDGTLSSPDGMQLSGGLRKDKSLVFVAHLNHFMSDSLTPNPLYFTATYYTRFDESTQTFEEDSTMPFNDLFHPDPARIPLYFTLTDSSAIHNALSDTGRAVVTADVFSAALSPHEFVAPSIAFACQPLSVPSDQSDQFKTAYRAKMWVSSLNSAYFIYNPAGNTELEAFQEARFNILRQHNDYSHLPESFLRYYTHMPQDVQYRRILDLAARLAMHRLTVMDKVLAVRDYFTQKNTSGEPLFAYSDNPGIPGIPSASKLNYFLFENRKGYCAYFAGATLFLLRAMGIPSRIAAGYMTIDRSSKNPGWYWFYADQAHAWVQVYFPGYGWLDFDTTIPDPNTQESPQPDGTPPLGQLQSYFVADGIIAQVDPEHHLLQLKANKLLVKDQPYQVTPPATLTMDISLAKVNTDTGAADISVLHQGQHITAASSDEAFKALPADDLNNVFAQLPTQVPVDEIKIISNGSAQKTLAGRTPVVSQHFSDRVFWILLALVLLWVLSPRMVYLYYRYRARRSVYFSYRLILYYLHMLDYSREGLSPVVYADRIDTVFQTALKIYLEKYQEWKYRPQKKRDESMDMLLPFFDSLKKKVNRKISWKQRFAAFFNVARMWSFLTEKI